jgi:hypothetical protein
VSGPTDDELLGGLRELFDRVDPPPQEVTEFARAALGWRSLEADLAELLEDSALETGLATATRSGAATSRRLSFRGAELAIEVEVGPEAEGSRRVMGMLVPASGMVTIEVQELEGGILATVETDVLGRFRLELPDARRIRFRVARSDGPPVESSWVSL